MTPQRIIAIELLKRFPKAHSKSLARIVFEQNPLVFRSLDSARSIFRALRGADGSRNRAGATLKEFQRAPRRSGDPFKRVPASLTHFDHWSAAQIDGPAKALILSDIHIPYHSRESLIAALQYGKKNGADLVLLNGDTADCFTLSRWEKDPRKRSLKREIEATRDFLEALRETFPKARIIFKLGNHEERWESYLSVKAPELIGVADFEMTQVMHLDRFGIECVTDKRPIRLGRLNVIHGHEYRFAISNPVNAARGLFLRAKAYALCGHFHQKSEHSENNLEQKSITTWSTGCLCDLHPDYAPLNNWSHGFAMVQVFHDGKFEVKNHKVSGGKVY